MEKEFVPYELALRMKRLGFKEKCLATIDQIGCLHIKGNKSSAIRGVFYDVVNTPTFSQAFRWFREKHSWQHSIDPTSDQHRFELGYNYWIWNNKTGEEYHTIPKNRPRGDWEYETYEEAELACLKKLIEIVEKQK